MKAVVKSGKRAYRAPRRAAQAARTEQAILKSAHRLFTSVGWSRTTIAAIAAKAAVSVETVYATFGNKPTILRRLITEAIRGDAPEIPLLEQPGPRAIQAETDQRRQIALFAADIAKVLSRVAPLLAVVRAAAEAEPRLRPLYKALHDGRRQNLAFFVAALRRNQALRGNATPDEAVAVVWRLASPEVFMLMRDIEGLSPDDYAAWLRDSLGALLLVEA